MKDTLGALLPGYRLCIKPQNSEEFKLIFLESNAQIDSITHN